MAGQQRGVSILMSIRMSSNSWSSHTQNGLRASQHPSLSPGLMVPAFLKDGARTECSVLPYLPTWPRSRMKQSPVLKLSQLSACSVARMFFFPFTW